MRLPLLVVEQDALAALLHMILVEKRHDSRLAEVVPVCLLDASIGEQYLFLPNKLLAIVGACHWIGLCHLLNQKLLHLYPAQGFDVERKHLELLLVNYLRISCPSVINHFCRAYYLEAVEALVVHVEVP